MIFLFTDRAVSWILNESYSIKKQTYNKVQTMAKNIKSVLSNLVDNDKVDWITEEMKIKILKKNNNMTFKIGYPDFNITSEYIDEYYKNASIYL